MFAAAGSAILRIESVNAPVALITIAACSSNSLPSSTIGRAAAPLTNPSESFSKRSTRT